LKSIEVTGKTVKDAFNKGLVELGCTSADVEMQVIEMGSPGLFGMFGKPAKVRLTVKGEDPALDIEMPTLSLDTPSARKPRTEKRKEQPKAEKKEEEASAPVEEAPVTEETAEVEAEAKPQRKHRSRNRKHRENNASEGQASETRETVPAPIVEHEPFIAIPEEEQSETAKSAKAFLSGLTERMGVPVEIAICENEEQLRMQMTGENMSLLIGRRGETLDALQYLTSLNVNRSREDYLRVSIDTENYRAKREEALRKLAVRMAGRAKKSGRRVALEPMNPYERRILHSALQNDPEVTTHSEGEEPYRRVIITLK